MVADAGGNVNLLAQQHLIAPMYHGEEWTAEDGAE